MVQRIDSSASGQFAIWTNQIKDNGQCICNSIGCDFVTTNANEMVLHYRECPLQTEARYRCVQCIFCANDFDTVANHVKSVHIPKGKTVGDFEDSGSEAEVGKESTESDGSSGVEEIDDENNTDPPIDIKRKHSKPNPVVEYGPDRLGLKLMQITDFGENKNYLFFFCF